MIFFHSLRVYATMNRRIMTKTSAKERVTITGTCINGQRKGEVRRDRCMQGEMGEEGCNTMSFGFVGFGGKWGIAKG
ncbi:hypothetical protein K443DRAFT_521044 [Laccaria amethystina LaAM-08-1]|uniref:Uncharacterized protein n=1 Tax=Laccaria amethystina LaAM-08-1 TaxID=1095629 RepID=A0A0C9WTM7_9AGAR|nr:hypothetical protein K443DRAFT_521044 [Laccaria amethystina LaAM-08-1]